MKSWGTFSTLKAANVVVKEFWWKWMFSCEYDVALVDIFVIVGDTLRCIHSFEYMASPCINHHNYYFRAVFHVFKADQLYDTFYVYVSISMSMYLYLYLCIYVF